MKDCIGICSLCSGPVMVERVWFGTVPPDPTCAKCGATAKRNGPVIPMQRASFADIERWPDVTTVKYATPESEDAKIREAWERAFARKLGDPE